MLGKKLGMATLFSSEGVQIPVTVLEVGPCIVTQIKTQTTDGYNAVQVGFVEKRSDRVNKALTGHFKTDPEKIRFEKGRVLIPVEEGEVDLSFREAAAKVTFGGKGTVIMGRYSYKAEDSPLPFAVCWAKVAVDTVTRTVKVHHIIQAVDVGTPINPEVVRGQVEGGISMGLGFALMEQIEFDPRAKKPSSSDLLHYKIPTALDMPEIQVYIANNSYEPTGPFGAKSVGELPAVPVAAAVANAVAVATGEDITTLPLSKSFVTGGSWKY